MTPIILFFLSGSCLFQALLLFKLSEKITFQTKSIKLLKESLDILDAHLFIAKSEEIKKASLAHAPKSDEVKRKIAEGAKRNWEKRKAAKQAQQPEEKHSKSL